LYFGDDFAKGSVRVVSKEVRLAMVDECGVPVRLMTMGSMSTSVVVADGICEECEFCSNHVGCLGEVVVGAVLPLLYLNLFYRRVTAATVCVAVDESRFEEADEIGFVCRGS
jgi:hypothetical protein